jgi:hypothetical protein
MKTTIELAREAGFTPARDEWVFMDMLKAFEALVRADQREIDAKVADRLTWADNKGVASAIRARGETK